MMHLQHRQNARMGNMLGRQKLMLHMAIDISSMTPHFMKLDALEIKGNVSMKVWLDQLTVVFKFIHFDMWHHQLYFTCGLLYSVRASPCFCCSKDSFSQFIIILQYFFFFVNVEILRCSCYSLGFVILPLNRLNQQLLCHWSMDANKYFWYFSDITFVILV